LDLIEVLPPGLYEMILEDKKAEDVGADLLRGQYLVRLRRRLGGRKSQRLVVGFQYLVHRSRQKIHPSLRAHATLPRFRRYRSAEKVNLLNASVH
jgi:hypothetical protein